MGGGTVKVIAETVDEQGWSCTVYFGQDDEARDAMRAFSDQLRTGQLVAVADDAVERVARAMFIKELGEPDDWDKWQSLLQEYRNLASTAIAAMKDTQPALAAKGTGDE